MSSQLDSSRKKVFNVSRGTSEVCFFSSSNSEVVSTLNVGKLRYNHDLVSHLKRKLFRQMYMYYFLFFNKIG